MFRLLPAVWNNTVQAFKYTSLIVPLQAENEDSSAAQFIVVHFQGQGAFTNEACFHEAIMVTVALKLSLLNTYSIR